MSEAKPVAIKVPVGGEKITIANGKLRVPDQPIIPFIEGDGTGRDIWRASVRVFDAAVQKAYGGKRKIHWMEVFAGEKANKAYNTWLPDETVTACRDYLISIKGPLTTPVGGGIRSLNVALRQLLDLYVCLRPVRWFKGVPSPVKTPEKVDMVIFRENTEDIYAGIEFEQGSAECKKFLDLFKQNFPKQFAKIRFPDTSGIGLKPASKEGTERLFRAAVKYAIDNKRKSVTIVHKGNIMKFTEGAFRGWSYQLAEREFPAQVFTWEQWERIKAERGEQEANAQMDAAKSTGKVIIKDAIADITLQQVLTRPDEFDVVATMNLNGDYLSDALAVAGSGGCHHRRHGQIDRAEDSDLRFRASHARRNRGQVQRVRRYIDSKLVRTLRQIKGLNKRLGQRLGQIVFQILLVLQAYREAHRPLAHQRRCALLCRVGAAVQ